MTQQAKTEQSKRKLIRPSDMESADETAPSAERRRHGPVERPERPIADAAGRAARPYRAVDTLAIMQRRGSITAAMRQAGEDFRARFAVAQLDPLHAVHLSHLRLGEHGPNGVGTGRGCASRRRAPRCGAPSRRLAASARPLAPAFGMCWAGSRASRNGRSNGAGAAAGSARKPPRAS